MKVVVLGTRGFPDVQGGVEKHCEELYPRLVKLGCDVTVVTRKPYITSDKRLQEWKGVKFIQLWCPRRKSLEAIIHTFLGVIKARTISPDILHIHSIGPSLMIPLAKILGIKKVVMTHHGPDYMRAKWGAAAKMVLKLGERAGIKFSDSIIVISEWIKEFIKKVYNKNSVFIPNGVSIPELIPAGFELKRYGLESQKYALAVCRFVPEKGIHDLIDAYLSVKAPSFKLVVVGDADHETDYSSRIKKKAAEASGIVLTGFLSGNRLYELYSNAGLFVLPSYYEGLPIALLEAISYGLPVLVSDIPQHKEIPLSAECYFKCGDVNSLSTALLEIFSNSRNNEKGRYISIIRENYNWDNLAYKVLEVYKSAINQGNKL